jgi:hypothetical protein
VEPGSITITPTVSFTFHPDENTITFNDSPNMDSIIVCFQTMSPQIYGPYFNRDIKTYSQGRVSQMGSASTVKVIPKEEIFSFSDFESYGAITRGVTFGNRQNLFVNSALNLQLEGQLSEDLFVSASITDQNIPYQPEGNTQQIRDFDNVYIKLYNDKFDVTAGDVVLTNTVSEGYFLKYYKNVQGLSLNYKYQINEKWNARSSVSGAASKGQFSSAQLTPIEGVQGPYRLTGPNGERFIIVLANSERVFIDGQLMQRGFDRDYVVDYNLGEVTFSNSLLITRFTRIRIDFEYAEQYYSRSNINTTHEVWNEKHKFYFNFYQEKDNPNSPLGFDLGVNDLTALSLLGDNNGLGTVTGEDSVGYIEDAVLYVKRDSIHEMTVYSIFQFSTDPDKAEYKVSFTEVGFGKGDYLLQTSTANGRIYQWVGPEDGVSQGSYAPVRILPLPNKKQMMVIGNKFKINQFENVSQEVAISNRDLNLYSDLDDKDNSGYAWRGSLRSEGRKLSDYTFKGGLSVELVEQNFQYIDRFRAIEYDRNWGYNIFQDSINRADRIVKTDVQFRKDQNNLLYYKYSYRNRTDVVEGHQHDLIMVKDIGPFNSKTSFYRMVNDPGTVNSDWTRFRQEVRLNTWKVNPGYVYELDHQTIGIGDSLTSSLMHYHLHDFYLETGDTLKTRLRADYIKRLDQTPVNGEMQEYTEADEYRLGINTRFLKTHTVAVTANYRKVEDKLLDTKTENVLGKFDWQSSAFDNILKQNTSFSTANIRELRREFIYIMVPTGQGTHTWRDENADGIQDLNEFYEAINIDEKNYAKIFTPTDEYISAFQSTFLHSLDVQFPQRWKSENAALSLLSKFSLSTNVRLNFKSTDNNLANRLNPFQQNQKDESVISARNQHRYSLFYNRNGSGVAFDLNRTSQENKSLLVNGFELRDKSDWMSNVRWTMQSGFMIRFQGGIGETTNQSDFLDSRNFVLQRFIWAPALIWQPSNSFRVSGKVEIRNKSQQKTEIDRSSSITDYSLESTFIQSGKGNLNAQFQWLNISFKGDQNTYLGYELLEGLQPGQNQKWNLNWQQSLSRGLQLTLQYNGRKSTGNSPIHIGTMQVTAFF